MKNDATLLLSLLLTLSLEACSRAPAATAATAPATAAQEASVSIRDFAFAPTSVTIAVGTTVRWKNLDGEPHTVRSVETDFRSDALDQNDSFAHKFTKPGTYRYVCSIHPQMTGTIVVKSASAQ
jgi:plastocyanin